MLRVSIVLLSIVAVALCARVAVEDLSNFSVPREWARIRSADPNEFVRITLAVKQQNMDELERIFWAVSDPQSPNYGQHLSYEEVNDLVRPLAQHSSVAAESLLNAGGKDLSITDAGDFVSARMTVQQASAFLETEFSVYRHESSGTELIRSSPYTLHHEVAEAVDFVGGTVRFPTVRKTQVNLHAPEAHIEVTPRILRKRYNTTGIEGKAANNSQAVAQFLGQYYSPLDLDEFFLTIDPFMLGHHVEKVVGPNKFPAGTEASLDIEYIMSVGAKVPTWFWSTEGLHEGQEPFLDWIMLVGNTSDAPWIHSVSYGDDENSVTADYALRINQEFIKFGARGISIMFASGDSGVGGEFSDSCQSFVPNFPTSSPYVTAVGASQFGSLIDENKEEVASLSGGGFSNLFARPDYQVAAVKQYMATAKNLPAAKLYNQTGRGYPDVSALGDGYTVVVNFIPMPGVAGTSCASPVFSAVMSLVNDVRLQNGKAPMGFLNPFIYQTAANVPGAFYDVTEGSNPGCDTDGFLAAKGWDPASGVGTPNYTLLVEAAMKAAKF